ncbi:sulfur carrier protein ThiS [Schnuerera sp. xch1]|uniref:sulfur carrier protein ThiS n=1 Tax=Schnuerera sp. xch1 TaxID=2874283 RepID=UPI001CBC7E4E|nr:sulfur carrier protein ThiS [Schnuerera sp. xch1]MBZ2174157.1 sulfur carrier protein ThiS [Schnuerera sp. xch1]
MNVIVNGKPKIVKENTTIEDLLYMERYNNWVGVWVNNKQLLEKEYSTYIINEEDEIKIIRPLGGG